MNAVIRFLWPGIPDDPTALGAEVRRQQFIQIAAAVPTMSIANVINALLAAFLCQGLVPLWLLLAWTGFTVVVSVERLFSWYRNKNRPPPKAIKRRSIVRSTVWSGLGGALWGMAGLGLALQGSILHHVFLAFVIGGQAAGAAVWMSPALSSSYAYIWLSTFPLALGLFLHGQPITTVMGVMMIFYAGATFQLANKTYNDFLERVRVNLERDKMMEHVASSERRLRDILHSSPFGVAMTDIENGEIIFANNRNSFLFGTTIDDMKGRNAAEFYVDAEKRDELRTKFDREGRIVNQEIEFRRIDGSTFRAWVTWERYSSGGVDAILSWVYDISDLLIIQEELRNARDAAEAASSAKTEFLSSMSHELRTPLNAILGFAQLMNTDKELPLVDLQQESVDQILGAGKHLLDLIDQVLDLARIEGGDMEISVEGISVGQVLKDSLALAEALAASREIKVILPPAGETPHVRADATRLRQVLLNLLSNAVKYNREHGSVTLDYGVNPNGTIRLSVSDSGNGIPKDKQGMVFEPFNRLGAETSSVEGTGIGLTICKRLVEMMEGEIGFESTPGTGSTFWIDLPADGTASEPDRTQAEASSA